MAPSTATLVCTLVAKTIEISFVTVYVALLGQVLTRRAFIKKAKGVTLAEMTMRNWVIVSKQLCTLLFLTVNTNEFSNRDLYLLIGKEFLMRR